MNVHEEEEIKKEFQLERVILFSDAVFAIIITIMVIDIKLPENLKNGTVEHFQEAFYELIPKLIAYGLSFLIVAAFWMRHLKIFSFLRDYNAPLLVLNLLFLFAVSLFPFTVSMISGILDSNVLFFTIGINVYVGIILATFFAQTLLTWYIVKNKVTLCVNNNTIEDTLEWKVQRVNIVLIPILAAAVYAINYYHLNSKTIMFVAAALGAVNGLLMRVYYPNHRFSINLAQLAWNKGKQIRTARSRRKQARIKVKTEEEK
ncbi:TMEM175 family protein [Mucilaginibacter jinjuensis]|uniref:TMEM175 family protein n=1 Tax=Mucilaginibacter jinjuensis TaxID=1176721 RepID=A0ABY7TDS8_9SPHI|nr:TMEM175 family protein [Mucilaginibacter jinjuensis]WCT14670.1 TMEM175 family protein [Mucilaginibacter jinjuensis]